MSTVSHNEVLVKHQITYTRITLKQNSYNPLHIMHDAKSNAVMEQKHKLFDYTAQCQQQLMYHCIHPQALHKYSMHEVTFNLTARANCIIF